MNLFQQLPKYIYFIETNEILYIYFYVWDDDDYIVWYWRWKSDKWWFSYQVNDLDDWCKKMLRRLKSLSNKWKLYKTRYNIPEKLIKSD